MKRATGAALKRVNAENLARLGAERLAELLITASEGRPELKRRLRMELAAAQGPEHLAPEIEKRLNSLETSGGQISWRQRPTFLRDLNGLRVLIAERMAPLDQAAALDQLWRLVNTSRRISQRVRGRDEALHTVFDAAAGDIGGLLGTGLPAVAAIDLAEAIFANPKGWREWLPSLLKRAPEGTPGGVLRALSERTDLDAGFITILRQLADADADVDAFISTFSPMAMQAPASAAEIGKRLLDKGRIDEAGEILKGAATLEAGSFGPRHDANEVNFDWESAWIDYLDASGQAEAAQAVRWASFERTLSVHRLRAFTKGLVGFDDVEAEQKAFAFASSHRAFRTGLRFLMSWPALSEAAQMIMAREDEVNVSIDEAETWAAMLRRRQPKAAHLLLRKAAAAAFRRRDFKTSDRLTLEADAIEL